MFRTAIRQFIEREIMPHVEEWEAAGRMPRSIWPRLGELGFLGVEYDEKYGGKWRGPRPTAAAVVEAGPSRSGTLSHARGVPSRMGSPHPPWHAMRSSP